MYRNCGKKERRKVRDKIIRELGKYLIVIGIIIAIVTFYNSVERTPLQAEDNTEFVKAVVTETTGDNLPAVDGEGDS